MIQIWAFIGVNGSGKDFRANLKHEELPNSKIFDFSDGVRDFTFSFLGWKPKNTQEYEEFKNGISTMFLGNLVSRKGRDFLDNIGLRMRQFDSKFWANYTFNMAKEGYHHCGVKNFIFNSVRYWEEVIAIKDLTGMISVDNQVNVNFIFCDYRSDKYDDTEYDYQKLALKFKREGFKDGDIITNRIIGT